MSDPNWGWQAFVPGMGPRVSGTSLACSSLRTAQTVFVELATAISWRTLDQYWYPDMVPNYTPRGARGASSPGRMRPMHRPSVMTRTFRGALAERGFSSGAISGSIGCQMSSSSPRSRRSAHGPSDTRSVWFRRLAFSSKGGSACAGTGWRFHQKSFSENWGCGFLNAASSPKQGCQRGDELP